MIGEIPSGKPGIVIREHLCDCAGGLDVAVGARDLPHPVQKAADREIRGELEAARIRLASLFVSSRPPRITGPSSPKSPRLRHIGEARRELPLSFFSGLVGVSEIRKCRKGRLH